MEEVVCGVQSEEEGDEWQWRSTQTYCFLNDNTVRTGTSSGLVQKFAQWESGRDLVNHEVQMHCINTELN